MVRLTSIFALLMLVLTLEVSAQEQQPLVTKWQIVLSDGNEFIGEIERETADSIFINALNYGVIGISKSRIKERNPIKPETLKDGVIWDENPQSARYFWAPNGYGLAKGEGYYQNVWVMFNQVSYGFSKYFSIGTGIIPLFLFAGEATPIYFTPKVSFPIVKEKFNMGAGVLMGTIIGESNTNFALTYGVATLGGKDANFTVGLGYGYVDDGWSDTPIIQFGGMARIGRKGYLLSENYIISDGSSTMALLMLGGRTVWPKVSLDYGLVIPAGNEVDQLVAIPWLGLVVPF